MRLRTLPVSIGGVLVAWGFGLHYGVFKPIPAVICLIFALLCQIASNFANEYYDYRAGRDAAGREGPRRGVTEGDITPQAMRRAVYGTLAAACLLGLSLVYWGGWWLIAAGAVIVLGALAYSAGPFPLSTHCLGEVAVIFFFGIVPINLTYYVMAGTWQKQVVVISVLIGMMIANVLIVNNTRDIPDDKRAHKHTLATVFGPSAMRALYLFNGMLGALGSVYYCVLVDSKAVSFIPIFFVIAFVRLSRSLDNSKGHELNRVLVLTSILCFCYCLTLAILLGVTEEPEWHPYNGYY